MGLGLGVRGPRTNSPRPADSFLELLLKFLKWSPLRLRVSFKNNSWSIHGQFAAIRVIQELICMGARSGAGNGAGIET